MSVFRIWNRVPPSIEWHLSVKCHARQALVTREFAVRVGAVQRLPSGERVLGWPGTRHAQVELPHVVQSTKK